MAAPVACPRETPARAGGRFGDRSALIIAHRLPDAGKPRGPASIVAGLTRSAPPSGSKDLPLDSVRHRVRHRDTLRVEIAANGERPSVVKRLETSPTQLMTAPARRRFSLTLERFRRFCRCRYQAGPVPRRPDFRVGCPIRSRASSARRVRHRGTHAASGEGTARAGLPHRPRPLHRILHRPHHRHPREPQHLRAFVDGVQVPPRPLDRQSRVRSPAAWANRSPRPYGVSVARIGSSWHRPAPTAPLFGATPVAFPKPCSGARPRGPELRRRRA